MGGKIRHVALVLPGLMKQLVEAASPHLRATAWVLVPQADGANSRVEDCSELAREFGIASGMRVSEVRRRFPQLQLVAAPAQVHGNFRRLLVALCEARTSLWSLSNDGACMDLSGAGHRFDGDWDAWANRLRAELEVSAGVSCAHLVASSVRGVSEALARDGAGIEGIHLCQPGSEALRVASVSLESLPWVSREHAERLRGFGILDLNDVRRKPRTFIQRHLGSDGNRLAALAMGVDPNPAGSSRERIMRPFMYALDFALS